MYDKNYYLLLERNLENVLTKLPFTKDEFERIKLYLDPAEYGLSFELLCYIIENNKILISENVYIAIEKLGKTILFDTLTWEGLRPLVK